MHIVNLICSLFDVACEFVCLVDVCHGTDGNLCSFTSAARMMLIVHNDPSGPGALSSPHCTNCLPRFPN